MEKDIIRISDVPLVCEECGKDIQIDEMVNEFNDGEETMFYCMECLPSLIEGTVENTVWKREG
jgi:uncharacterized Zn finger protein